MPAQWGVFVGLSALAVQEERAERRQAGAQTFGFREDYEYMKQRVDQDKPGRQRLLAFEQVRRLMLAEIYDKYRLKQSYDQRRLLDEMRNSLLIRMYGGVRNVIADMAWLRETIKIRDINDAAAIIYPRRHGKTLTQTIASGITGISQPGGNVYNYNMTADQAASWHNQTVDWMMLLEKHEEWGFVKKSHTAGHIITILSHKYHRQVSIKSYGNCSTERAAQSLRGTGNNAWLVNLDEGLFFAQGAYKVIMPVVANGAALVITSSMPAADTAAFDLTKAKYDTGRAVMRLLDWRNSCNDCRLKEQRLRVEVACPHVIQRPITFRSRVDTERLKVPLSFSVPVG